MIQSIKAERTVDLAADAIRRAILACEFGPGDFLPSERSLSGSLGINRLTLRAALARLQSEGLVRPEQGNGVRVLDFRATAGLDVLQHLVGGEEVGTVRSFLELRRVVGAEAVALASQRATTDQIARLEALAQAQQGEGDAEVFAERDLRFARETVRAADNLAMELLLNSVEHIYRAHPELMRAMHRDLELVRSSYQAVLGLIRAGDPEAARKVMRQFFERHDEQILAALEVGQ